jgi:predicted RNase H-like HicB family nuclease
MDTQYTAIVKQQGDWWIGWIEEVPGVNCQERTREELIESLRVTLHEAIDLNRQDAIASAGIEYEEEPIALPA